MDQKELYYTQFGELLKEINIIKEDIKKINNKKKSNIDEMALRNNDNNKEQIMIKFEKDNIKHDLYICDKYKIENIKIFNIKISNIGNKNFENLFFVIDTNNSSKNISFHQGINTYNLSLNKPFSKGQNLTKHFNLFIKNPSIGEYSVFIYVREKEDGENLSLPLKIKVNVIGDKEEAKRQIEKIFNNENIDLDLKRVYQMYEDLNDEYFLISIFNIDEIIKKIIEYKCDREKLDRWIEDSL